jgi:hypothetical protein
MSILSSYECIDSNYLEGLGFKVLFPNCNPPIATKRLRVRYSAAIIPAASLIVLTYNGGTKTLHLTKPYLNEYKKYSIEDGVDLMVVLEKIKENEYIIPE